MIYTSYFAMLKKMPKNYIPISICAKVPEWYTGLQYKKLAPKYDFFMKWKQSHDNEYYIQCFNEQVLSYLNPYDVISELINMLDNQTKMMVKMTNCPIWSNPDIHIVLICYEKPSDFCHRHLVAYWFNNHCINCKELSV